MTTIDGFYDSTAGDRVYNSQNFSDYIAMTRSDGYLMGFNDELLVEESGTPAMSVVVNTGGAFVQGRFLQVTAAETLVIAAADPTNPRIDRIVIRADESSGVRETLLAVLTGTPAGAPTAPSLTRTSTIWEISIAQIAVAANETEITDAEITDERNVIAVCGISTIFGGHRGIGARVSRSTNQSIGAAATDPISFDTEAYDTFDFFDIAAPTLLTVRHKGIYLLTATFSFAASGNVFINKTGIENLCQVALPAAGDLSTVAAMTSADKGNTFRLTINNATGGAVDAVASGGVYPSLSIALIGFTF